MSLEMMKKQLNVGAGSAEIIFGQDMFPTEGFDGTVHDNPHARVLLIDGDTRMAIVAIELVVVAKPFVADIKKILGEVAQVNEENIWVHGTHAISTPHAPGPKPIGPPELRKQPTEREKVQRAIFTESLNAAVTEAAKAAAAGLAPAKMGYGVGKCDVNISSRVQDKEHGMMEDIDGLDVNDKDLTIVKFETLDGAPIAVLMNYCLMSNAIDNSEMQQGTRQISSDVPGKACMILEEKLGAPVMFTMAAGADQKPKEQACYPVKDENGERVMVDKGVAYGLELVERYGTELADAAQNIINNIDCTEGTPEIACASSSVVVKNRPRPQGFGGPGAGKGPQGGKGPGEGKGPQDGKAPEMGKGPQGDKGPGAGKGPGGDPGTAELVVLAARLGNIGLVATNPELCCATELELKEKSPFDTTLLISFTDGPKGIMADKGSFAKQCGEQRSSFAEEGSAEKFVEAAVKVLGVLK